MTNKYSKPLRASPVRVTQACRLGRKTGTGSVIRETLSALVHRFAWMQFNTGSIFKGALGTIIARVRKSPSAVYIERLTEGMSKHKDLNIRDWESVFHTSFLSSLVHLHRGHDLNQ